MSSEAKSVCLNAINAPHIILGVHSNADDGAIMSAFAMRSKRIKSEPNSIFTIQDLTTALDTIQKKNSDSSHSLRYRVPADPRVITRTATFSIEGVEYQFTSDFSNIDVALIEGSERENAAHTFLYASLDELLKWNFEKSIDLAKVCLRISQDEDLRDEALNILAANLAFTGEANRSVDALKKAVEGRWNLALQTNLALIATEQEPALAVNQMSFLIDGAQTIEEKLTATRIAIALWRQTQSAETGSNDEDDFSPLPQQLLQSMYSLISHASISEEDFFDIGMFLARVDSEKFIASKAIDMSAHWNTLCAEALRLRAKGIFEFISDLVTISSRDTRNEKPWLQNEVNELVEMLNSRLTGEDENGMGVSFAFKFLEQGLDCSNFVRTALRPLLIAGISETLGATDQPNDKFLVWHQEAGNAISQNTFKADEERLSLLQSIHSDAGNTLGFLYHRGLIAEGRDIENAANSVKQRMSGLMNKLTANKPAIRSLSNDILNACDSCVKTYNDIIPIVSDSDLETEMKNIRKALLNIRAEIQRFT